MPEYRKLTRRQPSATSTRSSLRSGHHSRSSHVSTSAESQNRHRMSNSTIDHNTDGSKSDGSRYAHTNVSRTSIRSKSSPQQMTSTGSSVSGKYARTNVSRISLSDGSTLTGISRDTGFLSYDEFKQLRKENELLRREFQKMKQKEGIRITDDGIRVTTAGQNDTMIGHSTATLTTSNRGHEDSSDRHQSFDNFKDMTRSAAKVTANNSARVVSSTSKGVMKVSKNVAKATGNAMVKGSKQVQKQLATKSTTTTENEALSSKCRQSARISTWEKDEKRNLSFVDVKDAFSNDDAFRAGAELGMVESSGKESRAQDPSIFPDVLGHYCNIVTNNDIPASMSILTEDTTMKQSSRHDKQLTKSVKKAAKTFSHTSSVAATTILHTTHIVAPKLATARKAVATNIGEVTRVGTKAANDIADEMAVITRESIDAAIIVMDGMITNPSSDNVSKFDSMNHDGKYADYVYDPDYKVNHTPPPQHSANPPSIPYNYLSDPSTPYCLRAAMMAGVCSLPENHPEHPEYLPEGIPREIDVNANWEEKAGFKRFVDGNSSNVGGGEEKMCVSVGGKGSGVQFSSIDVLTYSVDSVSKPIDMDGTVQGPDDEEIEDDNADDGADQKNLSMWAVAPDEDIDYEDDVMNLGDIMIDTNEGEAFSDAGQSEFCCVRSDENSPSSCGTYHIGDVEFSFGSIPVKETCSVNQKTNNVLFETDDSEDLDDSYKTDHFIAQWDTLHNKTSRRSDDCGPVDSSSDIPFETPFSVQKGERPLTFTEFKKINRRVLFNEDKPVIEEELLNVGKILPENCASLNHFERESTSKFDRGDSRIRAESPPKTNEDATSNKKPESGKRALKGRVFLSLVCKKISKVKSKGQTALRQVVLIFPSRGTNPKVQTTSYRTGAIEERLVMSQHKSSPMPSSPSSASAASVASSLMTNGSCTKRIIGAIPVYSVQAPTGLAHGAINYNRRFSESTAGDEVPPPPMNLPRPSRDSSETPDEDAVSYIAAAMSSAIYLDELNPSHVNEHNLSDDVASIVATINVKDLDKDEESSVFVIVSQKECEEGSCTVVSGFDGSTPLSVKGVFKSHSDDDSNATDFDLKPNNLAGLFTDMRENNRNTSFLIEEAEEGKYVLTPTTMNQNVSEVFRQSTGTPFGEPSKSNAALLNLLPVSTAESDNEDDDILLYHDGCTIIRATSTFGDNTIITSCSASVPFTSDNFHEQIEDEQSPSYKPVSKPAGVPEHTLETPELTPDQSSFSKQAGKNGSFLFSPDNMGRAGPRIRAQERAALKKGCGSMSLTLLPSSRANIMNVKMKPEIQPRQRSSSPVSESSVATARLKQADKFNPVIVIEPTVEVCKSYDNSLRVEIHKKPIMSMAEAGEVSFKSTLNKCSTEEIDNYEMEGKMCSPLASVVNAAVKKRDEFETPLMTNCAQNKKYPRTPFPEKVATDDDVSTHPDSTSSSHNSPPSEILMGNILKKKPSLKQKAIPKSALRTRKGLVKDRVCDIQQRIDVSSAVTDVNGRLKKNHSYRFKHPRRMTNGDGALAPQKAVLQPNLFIRSVPIGVAKSYSRDESETGSWRLNDPISIQNKSKSSGVGDNAQELIGSKNNASRVKKTSRSPSTHSESGSSHVSESTECDPFNSLLGKLSIDDDQCSSDSHDRNIVFVDEESIGKENTNINNVDHVLPFKSESSLVKPAEINQHDKRIGLADTYMPPHGPQFSSLQCSSTHARKWRTLAAAAVEKKSCNTKSIMIKGTMRND